VLSALPLLFATVSLVDEGVRVRPDVSVAGVQSMQLFALRDEVVAFQVVVHADGAPLADVEVEVVGLEGVAVDRFVGHFVRVERPSGSPWGGALGWRAGAAPRDATGWRADALIPVAWAPSWAPYPLSVPLGERRVVWIDLTVPADQAAGRLHGEVRVRAGSKPVATRPIDLDVRAARMPARPVRTMLFYNRSQLRDRMGPVGLPRTERQLWRLLHRHRVTPLHDARSAADVGRLRPALDGSLYTAAEGYGGPAAGVGDDVVAVGAYGALGAPDDSEVAGARGVALALDQAGLKEAVEAFVYAVDEQCGHAWGPAWVARAPGLPVGWTCSDPVAEQPVDIVMKLASAYDPKERPAGKRVWIYNGVRPFTGAFGADVSLLDLRANGWIAGRFEVPRWFYWHAVYWNGWNPGGRGPIDPFASLETFHNQHGEWGVGEGVLLYPGRQRQFPEHDLGVDAVIPSARLKAWRRGIQDAGYLALARAVDAHAAEGVVDGLLPAVFTDNGGVSWPADPKAWVAARRALLAIIEGDAPTPPAWLTWWLPVVARRPTRSR